VTENVRTVMVTGGSRGLGERIVETFLDRGDAVATCSRTPTPQIEKWLGDESLADRFHYEALDLADRAAGDAFVKRVANRFGNIDVLVNNAGVSRDGVLALMHDDDVDAILDLKLRSTISITRSVVRRMLPNGAGRIVNISSIVGLTGYRGLAVYSAPQAALDGFTRALAREVGSRGITVNSVAPGYLRTEMTHGLSDAQLGQIVRRTPVGRLGDPDDVAAAVEFLASPRAAWITGHVLVVDGGLTA
jgi:3-oxoacyl-[acyl-carrier protein] reductase